MNALRRVHSPVASKAQAQPEREKHRPGFVYCYSAKRGSMPPYVVGVVLA